MSDAENIMLAMLVVRDAKIEQLEADLRRCKACLCLEAEAHKFGECFCLCHTRFDQPTTANPEVKP